MVLLRELDDAKDYPAVIYPVGSDWERQSSDFESGSSDNSGNDSDCVIISPSEFSSKNPNNRSLIVADSVATISTSMEISSRFTTDEFVSTFRQAVQVSGEGGENKVVIDPVAVVSGLSKFQVLSSVELISREDKPQSLGEYMDSMSTISAQQRAALVRKVRGQKAEAERAAASADAMSQLVVEESGVKSTKRKNSEGSGRIPVEIKKVKVTVVGEEEDEGDDEPLKPWRSKGRGMSSLGSGEGGSSAATKGKRASIPCCPLNPEVKKGRKSNLSPSLFTKDLDSLDVINYDFQKYARTSSLADLPFEDLRQATLDHHIQGVLLTYYLSNRQEHESIDFRNKMESSDTSLSALEKEFAAAKSKFEEDLTAVKAEQEEKVKAAMKAKEDEVVALKGKLVTVEGELAEEKAKAKTQQEEAALNAEALTGRIETLEVEGASQFDEGFKFALEQVKVAFPDVDAVKLGELNSVNQIVEGKIVPYVAPPSETYRPEEESLDSDLEDSQLTAESKLIPGKEKNFPCNKEG
ncbi:hypothetical protein TSUD_406560 [Trifolium subterraneum]|uniref:Uncharacterized protein n=1 Tax=Trifolium subterraneum TaxID=3900 RepID=A0A2Z6PPH1_TRISU|nr:hypothetical protein TSUD_406560 [Trifolium subterraneum]